MLGISKHGDIYPCSVTIQLSRKQKTDSRSIVAAPGCAPSVVPGTCALRSGSGETLKQLIKRIYSHGGTRRNSIGDRSKSNNRRTFSTQLSEKQRSGDASNTGRKYSHGLDTTSPRIILLARHRHPRVSAYWIAFSLISTQTALIDDLYRYLRWFSQLFVEDRKPPPSPWAHSLIVSCFLEYEIWTRLNAYGLKTLVTRGLGN